MSTKNICIWGDSIAYGAWDREGGWADRLRMHLHDETLKSKFAKYYFVYNLGIPGNTTADVLERFDAECRAREPHVILLSVGINDAQRNDEPDTYRVDSKTFRANIAALVAKARMAGAVVVVLGLTDIDEAATAPFERDRHFTRTDVANYDSIIAEEAQKASCLFLPLRGVLTRGDLEDGLHPNGHGHQKMFERIRDFLTEMAVL